MFALAFLVAIDTVVALALVANGAIEFVRSARRPPEAHPLPPHEDPRGVTKFNDKRLDAVRGRGDESADQLIAAIAGAPAVQQSAGAGDPQIERVEAFYQRLLDARVLDLADHDGTAYRADLAEWVNAIKPPPASFRTRFEGAGAFFGKNFVKIIVILSTSALLEAFACANGARVLAGSEYLSKKTNRRLYETLQFVMYVNEPDCFKSDRAFNAILRVRLMHACIRWLLPRRVPNWKAPEWGVPVNQEDLLGMQMGFSGVVLRDLPKLGVDISAQEASDHIFLWNVVGQLLGAPMELRANDLGESLALIDVVKRRQQRVSDAGAKMTDALLEFHRKKTGRAFPASVLLMRGLAGDHVCDMLGVPWSPLAGARIAWSALERVINVWGLRLVCGGPNPEVGQPKYDVPDSLKPQCPLGSPGHE